MQRLAKSIALDALGEQNAEKDRQASAECERKRFNTRFEELDFKLAIDDRSRLSDQLIQTLLGDRACALIVNVTSMVCAWGLSID